MKKIKILVPALLSIAACGAIAAGSTYALFTSEAKTNVAITSGVVKLEATIDDFEAYTPKTINADGTIADNENIADNTADTKIFGNGGAGTAKLNGNEIELSGMMPGDKVTFTISLKNYSNVETKYRTKFAKTSGSDANLYGALSFEVGGSSVQGYSSWKELDASNDAANGEVATTFACAIELPAAVSGSAYQNKSAGVVFSVEAVQGNVDTSATYPTGICNNSFPDGMVLAYETEDGSIGYSTTIKEAANAGASAIYLKKDGYSFPDTSTKRSDDIVRDLIVYGNGNDLEGYEFQINMTDEGKAASYTLRIVDAKNVKIWGVEPNYGITQNVILENIVNVGNSSKENAGELVCLPFSGKSTERGAVNLTLKNCSVSKSDFAVYVCNDGTLKVTDCSFSETTTGLKISHKTSGTRNIIVENSAFDKCGCDDDTYSLYDDSAAIKLKTKGTINAALKDVAITNVVGSSSIVLGESGYAGTIACTADNVTIAGETWTPATGE